MRENVLKNHSVNLGAILIAATTTTIVWAPNSAGTTGTAEPYLCDSGMHSNALAPQPLRAEIDPCIAQDSTFHILMEEEPWERSKPSLRKDRDDIPKFHCAYGWGDAGRQNQFRAMNLAASGHYKEAINEINLAIKAVEDLGTKRNLHDSYNLTWYLRTRMRLFQASGQDTKALTDAEKIATSNYAFPAAVCLLENGKTKEAKSLFASKLNGTNSQIFESYFRYLLALCEERVGELNKAKEDFLTAARFFAMNGKDEAMKVCINRANRYVTRNISTADLERPSRNKSKIYALLKFFTTEKNVFDENKLKVALGAESYEQKSDKLWFKFRDPESTAFSIVEVVSNLQNNNNHAKKLRKLFIRLNTFDCSVTREECEQILPKERTSQPISQLQENTGILDCFKVPSGFLELTWYKNGFGSLYTLELFEGAKDRPVLCNTKWQPYTDFEWQEHINSFLEANRIDEAKRAANEWLEKSNSVECMRMQAKINAAEGHYDLAIEWIDKAIKKQKTRGCVTHTSESSIENFLETEKVEYLLGNHQNEAAAVLLKLVKPIPKLADDYFLKARVGIAQKDYAQAITDLKAAACEYFYEFRIVKRDECLKLITDLRKLLAEEQVR